MRCARHSGCTHCTAKEGPAAPSLIEPDGFVFTCTRTVSAHVQSAHTSHWRACGIQAPGLGLPAFIHIIRLARHSVFTHSTNSQGPTTPCLFRLPLSHRSSAHMFAAVRNECLCISVLYYDVLSCAGQHAVLYYRLISYQGQYGPGPLRWLMSVWRPPACMVAVGHTTVFALQN